MNNLPDPGYLLDQLLHSSLDVIYFKDSQSRMILCNDACARKHNWASPADGVGLTDFDVFAGEHAQQAFDDEQRIMATGEPLIGIEEKEVWPDGRITWCSSTKLPMRDDDGAIVGIFGITRDITSKKEAQLKAQRYAEQVASIKEMLEEDARMAGKLQRSFFLSEYPVFPEGADPEHSCIEFLHHFNKCNLVSGDYCSVKRLSDTKVSILLCDVLGTGARAALGASLIRGIMQDINVVAEEPAAYIGRLNEQLFPLLHPDNLLLDVTACYIVLDTATGQMQAASAGHPLPLHFRAGQPAKWLFENLVLRGPALAVDSNAKFKTVTCRMQPGDSVVLFTDGLFSVKNIQGDLFSEKRLLSTAQQLNDKTLGQIFRGLENAATEFSRESHFTDDVVLIGFHLRNLLEKT
jgi:sigma-B regulation protein RsbU (phosphoserine phosphatase)